MDKRHFIITQIRRQVRTEMSGMEYRMIEQEELLQRLLLEMSELKTLILDNMDISEEDAELLKL